MARRGRRRRGVPILSLGIVAAQVATAMAEGGGATAEAAQRFVQYYVGLGPGGFQPAKLLIGWGPWVAKGFVSKVARGFGARPQLLPGLSLS